MARQAILALLSACVLATPQSAAAQQPAQPAQQPQVTLTKLGDNFYAIDGQGGRMGALVGPDGVFIVDAQSAALTERLVAAIRTVSDQPLRFLVNTHIHADHTGGTANFGRLGVNLLARPLLRERLARPTAPRGGGTPTAPPPVALPVLTFDERTSIYMNGEVIELIPLPFAHTDGDTAVRFPKADVLMTGDVFRSTGYPNIDLANGGTLKGMLAALRTLAAEAGPNTTVAPGHGPITNRAAILAHLDMAVAVRDKVLALIAAGRTQEEIIAAKPTAEFDEMVGSAANSADRFVGQLFQELTRAPR
jgi:glyoxylase-like metal-dependent hydrolase (beta-lactamase superfamily II)